MMRRITDGFTRTVYLTRRYAIKVPCCRYGWRIFLTGLLCNMQERVFSPVGWPELCPVLWADRFGFILIMPRVPLLERELSDAEFLAFTEHGDYLVPAENKVGHFGFYEGRLVTVDYGS
jgi:hypothetical protein